MWFRSEKRYTARKLIKWTLKAMHCGRIIHCELECKNKEKKHTVLKLFFSTLLHTWSATKTTGTKEKLNAFALCCVVYWIKKKKKIKWPIITHLYTPTITTKQKQKKNLQKWRRKNEYRLYYFKCDEGNEWWWTLFLNLNNNNRKEENYLFLIGMFI